MQDISIFQNRLKKNYKKLRSWLDQESIEAFRAYEKDIPEYPYIVDIYKDYAVIYEKGKKLEVDELALAQKHLGQVYEAIKNVFQIDESHIIFKKREVQKGKDQYEKNDDEDERIVIQERKAKFYINLYDYLDTGLFLDHRPLRKMIYKEAKNKKLLNLFAYTGSISIAAALGGAHVTTVDMSKTYINWAYDNFRLNDIQFSAHCFESQNTFDFLKRDQELYDIVVLDPPSFSNSKRMDGTFDVQRDHRGLIELCMNRLTKNGKLYFSNNFRKFKLDAEIFDSYQVKNLTEKSIPRDFRDKKIHCLYEIKKEA